MVEQHRLIAPPEQHPDALRGSSGGSDLSAYRMANRLENPRQAAQAALNAPDAPVQPLSTQETDQAHKIAKLAGNADHGGVPNSDSQERFDLDKMLSDLPPNQLARLIPTINQDLNNAGLNGLKMAQLPDSGEVWVGSRKYDGSYIPDYRAHVPIRA